MARLRAVFTASRHLIGILLCTIALHVYAFMLTAVMKRLGLARCTVTDELIRRRDQLDCDDALQLRSEDTNLRLEGPTTSEASAGRTVTRTAAHSSGIALSVSTHSHQRYLGMWTPVPRENRMTGTILAALRQQAEKKELQRITARTASQFQPARLNHIQSSEHQELVLGRDKVPQHEVEQPLTQDPEQKNNEYVPTGKPLQHTSEVDYDQLMASPPPTTAEHWNYPSPCSETTLADDQNTYCLSLSDTTELIAVDNCIGNQSSTSTIISLIEQAPENTVIRGRTRTRRVPLNDSTLGSMGTPSRVFGDRERTDEGLLELRANASKEHVTPVRGHRRKVSLNLPVRHKAANSRTFQFPSPKSRWASAPCQALNQTPAGATFAQEERELEYKHRHTFIGTASLDIFLEILELSASHTVTTSAVVKAFTTLASNEQMLARQSSSKKDGWDVVSRITLDVQAPDYIAQTHIKLGSITLRQFLDLIPFGSNERCDAMAVLGAFCAASHMDKKAGTSTGSKARAFRSWMVRQVEGAV